MKKARTIIAIDPGTTQSAIVIYDTLKSSVLEFGIYDNDGMRSVIRTAPGAGLHNGTLLAVEMIACYGMPVGKSVFETCIWTGRFVEAWGGDFEYVYRRDVKLHLCNNVRAKDGNIRQALLDKFGGKTVAVGTKKAQGKLYGIKKDLWAALAVAVYVAERRTEITITGGGD